MTSLGGLYHLYLNHAVLPQAEHLLWHEAGNSLLDYSDKTIDVNVKSFVHLYTAATPHLLKSEDARVGVISSLAGQYNKC